MTHWRRLAEFHYRSHRVAAPRKTFCLWRRNGELCGVIVYAYPGVACVGRRDVLPKMSFKELNSKLSVISRVVVHPKYRTIGLGVKLVRETLPMAGTKCVEMPAVMAKYNPFAEKAGMHRARIQEPSPNALKIASILSKLGFNIELLGSSRYILSKLSKMKPKDVVAIKEAFITYSTPRFMKQFSLRLPYGYRDEYVKKVKELDLERLAGLIKVCGFLLQTKV